MGDSLRWSRGGGDGGRTGSEDGWEDGRMAVWRVALALALAFGRSVLFPSRTGPVYDT